jgi:DNA-binding MarR family transcriptional regulator
MAAAGFGDRRFPDGRVLRMCNEAQVTISDIGRELGITRQGASKIVTSLHDRRYVTLRPSPTDGREKTVQLTSRAIDYLAAQSAAARKIESQLRNKIGPVGFDSLGQLLNALGEAADMRMRDYLRKVGTRET